MKKLLTLLLSLLIYTAFSQDFHFSQFFASPLSLNPAATGGVKGDWRLASNFRSQWGWSSDISSFQTFGVSYDMTVLKGKLPPNDFIGIGTSFYSDQAGDAKFGNRQVNGFFSYHKSLDKSEKQYLSIGFQTMYLMSGFFAPTSNLYFDNQYCATCPNNVDLTANNGENFRGGLRNNIDFSTGVLWYATLNPNFSINAGIALSHITAPKIVFLQNTIDVFTDGDARLKQKLTLHSSARIALNSQVYFVPSFIFMKQGPATEFNIGSFLEFSLASTQTANTAWSIGAWYRFGDAMVLATKVDYQSLSIGFSYDLNVSSLIKASKIAGGPELAITYEGIFPKTRIGTGKILCPRF